MIGEGSLVALALGVSLWLRPWRQKDVTALATPMLASLVILAWLWALPQLHRSPPQLQWSGAYVVLLSSRLAHSLARPLRDRAHLR